MDAQTQIFLHAHTERLHHSLLQAIDHKLLERNEVLAVVGLVLDAAEQLLAVAEPGKHILHTVGFGGAAHNVCDERGQQLFVPKEEAARAR